MTATTGTVEILPAVVSPQGADEGSRRRGGGPGGERPWRPRAPFLAQMIGARAAGTRLAAARREAAAILGAYGEAAALAGLPARRLDRTV